LCTQAPQGKLGGILGALITPQGSAFLANAPFTTNRRVLGAATASASPTPSINPSPTGKTLVSSSANWVLNHLMISFLLLIILIIIAYYFYRKKKK
jgi:ascorbate-specific PTS system EIIC-type component UlaA